MKTSYIFIRLWGKSCNSFPFYINQQVLRAENSNAPQTAIYEKDNGEGWVTIGDMSNPPLANSLISEALELASK